MTGNGLGARSDSQSTSTIGNAFASGSVLVFWGLLFTFFPLYADLWPTPSAIFRLISVPLYLLGGIAALGGIQSLLSNPRQLVAFSVGLIGAVTFALHFAAVNTGAGAVSLTLKVGVFLTLLIGALLVAFQVPPIFDESSRDASGTHVNDPSQSSVSLDSNQESTQRFTRIESMIKLTIAMVGLIVVIIQLMESLLDS